MQKFFAKWCLVAGLMLIVGVGMVQPAEAMVNKFIYGVGELEERIDEMDTTMKTAHVLAECARALPMEDSDAELVIGIAKKHWSMANELMMQYVDELGTMDSASFSYDPFEITNLSSDAFDYLLEGTGMEGLGEAFVEMEQEYGVNALFAIAVARTESGLGNSKLAINKNNFFGMLGCSYDSQYDGVIGFAKLMQKSWYKDKTIEQIARTYCPPTAGHWAAQNKSFMQGFWDELDAVAVSDLEQTEVV